MALKTEAGGPEPLEEYVDAPSLGRMKERRDLHGQTRHDSLSPAPLWIPLILLLIASVIILATDLDLSVARHFWSPDQEWRLANLPWVQFLYKYGHWAAATVGIGGAIVWVLSLLSPRWKRAGSVSLFMAVLLAIGPGLVVNFMFKGHFGRPRPRDTIEFGGDETFHALGVPGLEGGTSFPSGHASSGFFWLGLLVYYWRSNRRLALGFGALGLLHGGFMGAGRILQGAHYVSDVLWAAGFVYLSAWGVVWGLNWIRMKTDSRGERT